MTDKPRSEEEAAPVEEGGEDPLAALEAERDQAIDQLKRVAADFDNFRKRSARDRQEYVALANERLVKELLPVLDDLERVLAASSEHPDPRTRSVEEGVRLVSRSLAGLLERHGLREIEAGGAFDPHVHEALLSQPSEQEEGAVIDVLQKGYRLGDRVLRPARVVIAAPVVQETDG